MQKGIIASVALSAAMAVGLCAPARAEFPEKPVEMTILFGSTAQTIGQLLAELMSRHLPQPVVPVARTGAGGAVGYQHVHGTAPDGYNIVWNSNSISTVHHGGGLPFDYTAFAPVAKISVEVPAIAVRADSGWETLSDMAADIKSAGRKLKVGASGRGSFTHLATEAILAALDLSDSAIHVPYDQGRAPVELLAGRLDAALQWPGQFVSHHEAGTLRILCVTSAARISQLPDVPTCAESGAGEMDIVMWRGLAAPAGTPPEAIARLEEAARLAAESEEFRKAAQTIGFEVEFAGHEAFGELIARDDTIIADLMGQLGLTEQ
ncbi:tripartite tricarboxylate transporter substrate binding protein [Rhodovulum tesquicola]|uniref:Tripartite-type tricarboxylate transporter receptor subunit TctC n=1 Tax=Rhodovulum steppense TaxID=540251 RepID=A0A4R1YW48_9RHOB|nr:MULTISPECIES: tripartite tricarboxylate transporter substrate binding protein [Rhodovulum]MCO8145649.1 tripartite tricarboxylate transporter substrate binding protein [Rhodovulum tesquicola]TCM84983.1 tripartite-type tricarboxylate transporter receptor subunit TctC [Rhodovulum steppense]